LDLLELQWHARYKTKKSKTELMKKIIAEEEIITAEDELPVVEVVRRFGGHAVFVMYEKWYDKASSAKCP